MGNELLPCPFCGGAPRMAHRHDEDDCYWSFIECKCGVRTRGHWVSRRSETCPIHFEEVRDEWNRRAALAAKDAAPCPHIRGEHGSQWCALAQAAPVEGVPAEPVTWQVREWILWDDSEDCWGDWLTLDHKSVEHFKRCAEAYPKKYQVRPIFGPQGRVVALARRFHEAYERLAPSFDYQTRPGTREFDPSSNNGRLMTAVCAEIFAAPQPQGDQS